MTTAVFKNAQTMAACRYVQAACNRNIIAALSRLFELKDMIQSKFTNRILRNSLHYVANNLHENTKKSHGKASCFIRTMSWNLSVKKQTATWFCLLYYCR